MIKNRQNRRRVGLIQLLLASLLATVLANSVHAEMDRQILITVASTGQQDQKILSSFGRNYRPIQKYSPELTVKKQVNAIVRDYDLMASGDAWTINSLDVYCAVLSVPQHLEVSSVITRLRKDRRIESVQRMFSYSSKISEKLQGKLATARPNLEGYNDPYFSLQYKNQHDMVEKLHAEATGKGIKIAVIDTGADTQHNDLSNQIHRTLNFVDDDTTQFNRDVHGTAISGIIAAEPNNKLGIVGLAPDAELWVMKACWQNGQVGPATCNSFTLANALSVGIDEGVDIFNISLSGPRDPLIERLINVAVKRGIVVVAADPVDSEHRYPALLPGVVDVQQGATDVAAHKISLSNIKQGDTTLLVDGREVLTTAPNGTFDFFSGSSMSTAIVSALGALLLERDGDLDMEKLREIVAEAF